MAAIYFVKYFYGMSGLNSSYKGVDLNFAVNGKEKVYRLTKILQYINTNLLMKDCLALKGGTAINLTGFNLPRLSVKLFHAYAHLFTGAKENTNRWHV